MISLVILLFFVGFLFKSFNRAVITIAIWMPVFCSVVGWKDWLLFPILSWIALGIMIYRICRSKIRLKDFPLRRSFIFGSITYIFSILICKEFLVMRTGLLVGAIIFPFLSWYAIYQDKKLWKTIFINLGIITLILTICGIIEVILGVNVIGLYLEDIGFLSVEEVREDYVRFGMNRCRSITAWCSTYGVICTVILTTYLLLVYYGKYKGAEKYVIYALCLILLIGIITSGTRSVYVTFIIASIPFLLLTLIKPKYVLGLCVILFLIYSNYTDLFNEIYDSFVNHEDVQGSSINLRQNQFNIAYNKFSESPIWGHGYWAINELKAKKTGLMGAESIIFTLIVDRGILGIISFFFFYWEIVKFLRKQGNFILAFIPIAFMCGKIMSAFINIDTTYILFYVFVLNQAANEYKLNRN